MTGDEVVHVYQRVQVEDKAMERGVRDFAIVARYDVLNRRLGQMAASQEQRERLIGEGGQECGRGNRHVCKGGRR